VAEVLYMKRLIITGLGNLVFWTSCKTNDTRLIVQNLEFRSIFASGPDNSATVYSLLGSGLFNAPRASNLDSLIKVWLELHPEAVIVPVAQLHLNNVERKSDTTYCWLIDNTDTINNYLVRNGAVPVGTMFFPTDGTKSFISKDKYEMFSNQAKHNENHARLNKLGIWEKRSAY
jgi:hypothetical protein